MVSAMQKKPLYKKHDLQIALHGKLQVLILLLLSSMPIFFSENYEFILH